MTLEANVLRDYAVRATPGGYDIGRCRASAPATAV